MDPRGAFAAVAEVPVAACCIVQVWKTYHAGWAEMMDTAGQTVKAVGIAAAVAG